MNRDRLARLLEVSVHRELYLDSVAVAEVDLDSPESRARMAELLRRRQAIRVAPHIYAAVYPFDGFLADVIGERPHIPLPAPHLLATALARQHGWRLGMPPEFARFLLGLADRPQQLSVISYDRADRREYPEVGLTLEPAPANLFRLTPAGQVLVQGLPPDATEVELLRIALEAAQWVMGEQAYRAELAADLRAGRLGEREGMVARTILAADRGKRALRQAPEGFQSPQESVVCVDGWWLVTDEDGCERLRARRVTGHPHVGDDANQFRSAPLVWLDEELGWARSRSRHYRLGLRLIASTG